jgi:uncharacterized membrane protein HdeD (DUF308 family)
MCKRISYTPVHSPDKKYKMKKHLPIYFYGAIIILVGIFLLFPEYYSLNRINLTIGITLTIGAMLAFMAAFSRRTKHVQFAYHEMHALAMLVYGISIILFCNTLEKLISVTAFLLVFYAFSEIIFCNWLFNLGQKTIHKIIIVRFLLGIAIGIGVVISMNFSEHTLEGFGILFIMVGINIMLYVPVVKIKELNEI